MSIEAEQGLLGGLMLSNKSLDYVTLTPDHFEHLDHKKIYRAIFELNKQDFSFDAITIGQHLQTQINENHFSYLVELANSTASANNIKTYAKIVKRDFLNKKLKQTGFSIQSIAEEGGDFDKNLESALNLFDVLKVEDEKEIISIKEHVSNYMQHLENLLELKGLDGLSTGFTAIDNRLQGLKDGELIIVGGRPSSGKSAYALNIANHVAQNNVVIFFSMEMPSRQVVQRSVAGLGKVNMNWLKGDLRHDDSGWPLMTEGASKLMNSKLIIDDNGTQTMQSLRVACKKQKNLRLVVVDYLQLMTGIGNNRTEQIGSITRGLKKLAKELNCPVIALSQLNRGLEARKNKRPLMSDLRESGDIEQDGDVIQLIYRDEYYYQECQTNRGYAEIGTVKFRDGEVGTDFLATDMAKSIFKDIELFNYQPYQDGEK